MPAVDPMQRPRRRCLSLLDQARISSTEANQAIVRLRVTVTHQRDGLAEELDDDTDQASIGPREQPMPRKLTLRAEGSDG